MCRFLGRRDDDLSTCAGRRRPRSAKARNRGGWCWRWCRGRYGDLAAGQACGDWIEAVAAVGLAMDIGFWLRANGGIAQFAIGWRCGGPRKQADRCEPRPLPAASQREQASVAAVGDRRRWPHEVSILIVGGLDVGRCLGSQPRAKVSMMIMRPPQQGQGRGSTRGSSAAAALGVSGSFERGGTASSARARAMLAARLPLANSP